MKTLLRHIRRWIEGPDEVEMPLEIHLPALGETFSVTYRHTPSRSVQARSNGSGELVVSGSVSDRMEVKKGLRRWLVRQARASLVPWLEELSVLARMPYGAVSVRGQRTRWASCSSRGDINLNYKLLFLSSDLVRYILNHELCHTIHLNHSRSFWKTLASIEPDYRIFNSLAKRGMEEVPEWAKDRRARRGRVSCF